jgi:RNA polymerase-interacting CarD/CdnL/TRCF family regulator
MEDKQFEPFKVDDFVVHPVYGVGHIVQIEDKQFSEKEARSYYKVILPKLTLWIPVEAQAAIGLRLVTARRDLEQYRTLLKSRPVPLQNNHAQRHGELAGRLKEGTFQVLCEVVRDLTVSGWQKPLGRSDAAILQKTRERLRQEWAASAGVSVAEATEEIDRLLRATHPEYSAA